ncbi:hypothetical protein SELMODRAFT_419446 [Selaginella moellendorffii]|uniref:Uncharacterized protein n=1 Tax=Selaginella moellendorffii TaxID=88036 RepID=D8S8Z6_SELML|nr:hypothetical protein SELMODRAFT_419446 [Selaginella moellendorffii]
MMKKRTCVCQVRKLTQLRLKDWKEGSGKINQEGVKYYNHLNVEDNVLCNFVFLDSPQVLEDAYKTWLSSRIVDDYAAYVEACFRAFGDRLSTGLLSTSLMRSVTLVATLACLLLEDARLKLATALLGTLQGSLTSLDEKQAGIIGITLDAQWHEPSLIYQRIELQLGEPSTINPTSSCLFTVTSKAKPDRACRTL